MVEFLKNLAKDVGIPCRTLEVQERERVRERERERERERDREKKKRPLRGRFKHWGCLYNVLASAEL